DDEPEEPAGKSRAPQQIFLTVAMLIVIIIAVDLLDLSIVARVALITIAFPLVLPLLRRLVPSTNSHPSTASAEQTMLAIDNDSGVFGGLAGGLVTGALLSVIYNKWTDRSVPLATLLPLVTAFFGIAVAALGWLVAMITSWFARLKGPRWLLN